MPVPATSIPALTQPMPEEDARPIVLSDSEPNPSRTPPRTHPGTVVIHSAPVHSDSSTKHPFVLQQLFRSNSDQNQTAFGDDTALGDPTFLLLLPAPESLVVEASSSRLNPTSYPTTS